MIVGIVGSRHFGTHKHSAPGKPPEVIRAEEVEFVRIIDEIMLQLPTVTLIVSGGAPGVDTLAEKYAQDRAINFKSYPTSSERGTFSQRAAARNKKIAAADCLIALPCRCSKGSVMTARMATAKRRVVYVRGVKCWP